MRHTSALYAACLGIGLTLSATAAAQSGPPMGDDTPQISDQARMLYINGMKAAEKKDWAGAHKAFTEAWKLNEHYQIAANLGSMEVKLGRYRDAAEHLAIYLRKAPQDKVKDRMRAMAFFDEAKKKVAAVQVKVNVNGADILVDDKVVALSPLIDDIYVEPGPRQIKVRMAGYKSADASIEAAPGSTQEVPLTLSKFDDTAPPITAPEPVRAPPPPPPKPADEPFKPQAPVIIAGIAVGAVGLLGGFIFTGVANGHASDADELTASLKARSQAMYGTPYACATGGFTVECQHLYDDRVGADTFGDVAVWSFVVGGLAGAGTAVYALVLPKVLTTRATPGQESATPGVRATLTPVASPGGAGLWLSGSF